MVSKRYNGKHPELSEQSRQETDAMDASAWTRVRVCADECLCHEKIFLFYKFTVTALLFGGIVMKNKANPQVLRSLVVTHSKELFMREFDHD